MRQSDIVRHNASLVFRWNIESIQRPGRFGLETPLSHYRAADGALLVFDIANEHSAQICSDLLRF